VTDPSRLEQIPNLTTADTPWLARTSGLPVIARGVLRADAARRCVDSGATAIWVSNHGGRQLDGAITSAEALGEVVVEVGNEVEVYVDGGVSSGTDVLRAMALGARGVFLGRPTVWELAVGGRRGVSSVIGRSRTELELCMRLVGRDAVDALGPDLLGPHR